MLISDGSHWLKTKTMEVSGYRHLFDYIILQNIFFCVQQKKETHAGLEQVDGEKNHDIFLLWVN